MEIIGHARPALSAIGQSGKVNLIKMEIKT